MSLSKLIIYYEQMAAVAKAIDCPSVEAHYNKMVAATWADAMRHAIHLD